MNKIRVGIFFGGPSREREVSFAGGRTVYDNLDKNLFEPVPVFVDALRRFVILDWEHIYKGSIRDFFPPVEFLPDSPHGFQIYQESILPLSNERDNELLVKIGQEVPAEEMSDYIDFAFLVLHGEYGEDGKIQAQMEILGIPYSGSDVKGAAIGMHKGYQKRMMLRAGWDTPSSFTITRRSWDDIGKREAYFAALDDLGGKYVVRPCNQGSSIGMSIHHLEEGYDVFEESVDMAFFRWKLHKHKFPKDVASRVALVSELTDIKGGLGFPMKVDEEWVKHPEDLLLRLCAAFDACADQVALEAVATDSEVLVEAFVQGREFSCIVLRDEEGTVFSLPPTEIVKAEELFDYRAKYLPGFVRKITPIDVSVEKIEEIRKECVELFEFFDFKTYARIDGFLTEEGKIYLNDPNTTSGMMPSSFFFHQAAQIGLTPSQLITFIIRASLQERYDHAMVYGAEKDMMLHIDSGLKDKEDVNEAKTKVGVILGGYSFERHISVESGRNIFEKLSSSTKYLPVPLFLAGEEGAYDLYELPIRYLLKDNADDIQDAILTPNNDIVLEEVIEEARFVRKKYTDERSADKPVRVPWEDLGQHIDFAFIALHGRPGEDGSIQSRLAELGIPFNGSSVESSQITIDKYKTAQILREHGMLTARQLLFSHTDYASNPDHLCHTIESTFGYPVVAKPVDDGCSSAVMIIRNRDSLSAYLQVLFREEEALDDDMRRALDLLPSDEFPKKDHVLIEDLIEANGARHFLEITGGLYTYWDEGKRKYRIFEASETLATDDVLSLEEKFLAGQGQNITPARYAPSMEENQRISSLVKKAFLKAAEVLDIEGYCRIDAFVRVYDKGEVEVVFIEVNSLPGMTPATCIFHQSALEGLRPLDFIDKIIDFSMQKALKPKAI